MTFGVFYSPSERLQILRRQRFRFWCVSRSLAPNAFLLQCSAMRRGLKQDTFQAHLTSSLEPSDCWDVQFYWCHSWKIFKPLSRPRIKKQHSTPTKWSFWLIKCRSWFDRCKKKNRKKLQSRYALVSNTWQSIQTLSYLEDLDEFLQNDDVTAFRCNVEDVPCGRCDCKQRCSVWDQITARKNQVTLNWHEFKLK